MREFQIGKNDAGQRLDKFITKTLSIPMSLLYKSIRLKKIKVNRKRAEAGTMLALGDTVQCFLAEELFERGKKSPADETPTLSSELLSRMGHSLDIVYEDENILLVNKPAGLPVHEDESTRTNTLIAYIHAYLYERGEYSPEREQSFAPALCNRIDRNTEGIVIAAKNAEALRVMNAKIKAREIDKFYLALVHGIPKEREKTLHGYLLKDERTNTVRVWERNAPKGAKEIVTRYRVLRTLGDKSLVEVELLTGRTHQIRAHMAYIGHPLVGDGKYGTSRDDRREGYRHQALCSYKLRFSFRGEPTALDYLSGRTFTVPPEKISFVASEKIE